MRLTLWMWIDPDLRLVLDPGLPADPMALIGWRATSRVGGTGRLTAAPADRSLPAAAVVHRMTREEATMGESRDVDDPRDAMRGMRKEVRAEQEAQEQHDQGGQEHATAAERRGEAASVESPDEAEMDREAARATADQSDADALAIPRGDAVTGGGDATRREPPMPGDPKQ